MYGLPCLKFHNCRGQTTRIQTRALTMKSPLMKFKCMSLVKSVHSSVWVCFYVFAVSLVSRADMIFSITAVSYRNTQGEGWKSNKMKEGGGADI